MDEVSFEWDHRKNEVNIVKHGVSFFAAQQAFLDPKRVIAEVLNIQDTKSAIIVLARLTRW